MTLITVSHSLISVVTGVTMTGLLANTAMGETFESCDFYLLPDEPLSGYEFSLLPYFFRL